MMHFNLCFEVVSLLILTLEFGHCICIAMMVLEAFMALAPLKHHRNCQSASITTKIKLTDESLSPDFQTSPCSLQRSRTECPIKKFSYGMYLTSLLMFTGWYGCTCIQITEHTKFWRFILELGVGLVRFGGLGQACWDRLLQLVCSSG